MEGYRFCPDHTECVAFLISKVAGDPLDCDDGGDDIDEYKNPYGEDQLARMFMEAQKKDLYFFTKLKNKGKSGCRNKNRTVGKGTWHGESSKNVSYRDKDDGVITVIGTVHTFCYREKGSERDKGYLMEEYHLMEERQLEYDPLKNDVLCVLRVNNHGKKDSRSTMRVDGS